MSRTTTTGTAPQAAKTAQPAAKPQAAAAPSCGMQEKIAMLAYQKWIKNGCRHGNDQKDWLEAEAEVKAEMGKTAARR